MYLLRAQVTAIAPFHELRFPLADEEERPRMVTVIHGGGGVGKTSLLSAIASTRPGYAVVQQSRPTFQGAVPHAICDWDLGQDDPERPHALRVATPNVKTDALDDDPLQRREQALFDKRAKDGGFAFLAFSSMRWFSRQPILLAAPLRTVAQYDVRAAPGLDDAARADLARETKQALAYAAIASALARAGSPTSPDPAIFGEAMAESVGILASLVGFQYRGVDPRSLEPVFTSSTGRPLPFDALPTRARHLVAFASLTTRLLWAAYPGTDPRASEAVVAIDEVDLHQDLNVQAHLVPALRRALPRVQWILTTTSPVVAASCDAREVLALRRLPDGERIELFLGDQARTH